MGDAVSGAFATATGCTPVVAVVAATDVVATVAILEVIVGAVVTPAMPGLALLGAAGAMLGIVGVEIAGLAIAGICTPGITGATGGFAPVADDAVEVDVAPGTVPATLFKSPRFLVSSATLLDASLACLSFTILSSAAAFP